VSGRLTRHFLCASLFVAVAGGNSPTFAGTKDSARQMTGQTNSGSGAATEPTGAYVAGKCPQVVIRDEGAVFRTYANGAKDDREKLIYQASLAQGTRQCTSDGTSLGITIAVQGRLVAGPLGGPGAVTLPIRVSVMDGENVLYSDVTKFEASIPQGETTAQFLFSDNKISVAGGSGGFVSLYVGFDQEAPKNAKPTKKK
jgi:hypothetical protein